MRTSRRVNRRSPYHLEALRNGAGIALHQQPHARSVAIGVWVRSGGRYELPEHAGISHFVEHLLFKGTRRRSCEALKQRVEGVGGSLNGFTAEEFTCFMAKVPKQHARRAMDALVDMLLHSRFDARDVEKEREVILEEIRMYEDTPGQIVHDFFNQLLWPDHPLGTMLSGSIDTVRRISREALIAYWRRMYQPRNVLVACVGAFDPKDILSDLRRLFRSVKARAPSRFLRAPRAGRIQQVRVWHKPTEQTHLCVGTYAVPRTHPERFALELLHVLLGANMSSRLFREVRERRGLAYEIGTSIKRLEDPGAFIVSAGCDTGKVTQTVETIFRELSRVCHQPVSRAELRRAKEYYAGQLLMGLEDPMDHMLWMGGQAVTVGRGARPEALLEHLERVTASDIRHVARELFVTPKMRVAVIGPVEESEASRLRAVCRIT